MQNSLSHLRNKNRGLFHEFRLEIFLYPSIVSFSSPLKTSRRFLATNNDKRLEDVMEIGFVTTIFREFLLWCKFDGVLSPRNDMLCVSWKKLFLYDSLKSYLKRHSVLLGMGMWYNFKMRRQLYCWALSEERRWSALGTALSLFQFSRCGWKRDENMRTHQRAVKWKIIKSGWLKLSED